MRAKLIIRPEKFANSLLDWYDLHGRKDLPWQQDINPYKVWISEIMLQQTQVKTVIPYFLQFIKRFPTVEALAKAKLDEVLQLWAGLGYYARARNLHKAAKEIVQNYTGNFPNTLDDLTSLPGIGRSTASAILSISQGQATPILDGNVKRVLTRLYGIHGWPGDAKITKQLWDIAEQLMPSTRTGAYTQAIMDLGATICIKSRPLCSVCPFTNDCVAQKNKQQHLIPSPKPAKILPVRSVYMLILYHNERVFLEKRPPVGIWGGLWSLPECPMDADIKEWCKQKFGFRSLTMEYQQTFRHTFSHYHLDINPVLITIKKQANRVMDSASQVWYNINGSKPYGLSSPVKKLLQQLNQRDLLNVTNYSLSEA